ncbi:MAG: hypothetical protein ABSA12_07395 [Verrucomicrobiia bacterium]|jgi:hypothetical protein
MKPMFVALTVAAWIGAAATANAWLGDSQDALTQRYGKPTLVQLTTGDIPAQKGYYTELKESYGTNTSLIAWTGTNYDEIGFGMDLVETRSRYTFAKDGLPIVVYIGAAGEKYNGVDFAARSAREIINSGAVWETDKSGDKFRHPLPLAPSVVDAFLENNKGDSAWADAWQPSAIPGTWLRRTTDKMRMAIAHGTSEHELYQVEVRMVDDTTRALD